MGICSKKVCMLYDSVSKKVLNLTQCYLGQTSSLLSYIHTFHFHSIFIFSCSFLLYRHLLCLVSLQRTLCISKDIKELLIPLSMQQLMVLFLQPTLLLSPFITQLEWSDHVINMVFHQDLSFSKL